LAALAARKNVFFLVFFVFFLSLFARDVVLLRSFRILPNVFGVLGDMFERAGKRRGIGEEEDKEDKEEEEEK
jgi:hypothetical protein